MESYLTKVERFNSTWLRTYFTTDIIRDLQSRKCPPPLFITIFLGANDACLPSFSAHVPLPEYEVNLRYYVDAILNHPATQGTKVILITPPPIDIAAPKRDDFEIPAVTKELRQSPTKGVGFLTYKSKQTYAEKVMEIAHSYEEKTPLVAGLDLWKAFMEFGRNRSQGEDPRTSVEDNEQPLPGSGLSGAHEFGRDVFADGLHFGPVVCSAVLFCGERTLLMI